MWEEEVDGQRKLCDGRRRGQRDATLPALHLERGPEPSRAGASGSWKRQGTDSPPGVPGASPAGALSPAHQSPLQAPDFQAVREPVVFCALLLQPYGPDIL